MNEPACLCHDHRGLAAAGGGHDQIAVFVDDDSSSLLIAERPCLDAVEELPRTLQFVCDIGLVGLCAKAGRVMQKAPQPPQHEEFGGIRKQRPANDPETHQSPLPRLG